jgi:nitronate monooxygenase
MPNYRRRLRGGWASRVFPQRPCGKSDCGAINAAAPAFPLASAAIAPLRVKAEAQGLGDFSPLWSGQNASGCKEIPAAQLTRELCVALS